MIHIAGRRPLLAVVLAAAVALTGCSSDDDGGASPAAGSEPAPEVVEGTDPLPPLPDDVALPIVFVHGFAGSAQQIESNAMRFVANGYPEDRIVAYDHDGAGLDIPAYAAGLAEVVDDTLAEFGVEKVYLIGHSRGTFVSNLFLGDPAQVAKVAKYVAIDGRPCPEPQPVPCIAPVQPQFPGQSHVEVATSKESFAVQYEFLVGEAPEVVDIVPQRAPVEISGRAVNFPANTGRDATLDIWAIDPGTGARTGDEPHASTELGPDGEFGPIELENGAHYEYALSSGSSPVVHHLYLQPYVRSSAFVRLLSSEPDGPVRQNTNVGEDHVALVIMRMREWHAEGDADVLELSVDGGEPVDVITDYVGNAAIGLHVHDDAATPGETTLAKLPYFGEQPFQSGIDVFLPAAPDASGTVTARNLPRGDAARPQTLNVPNWPSSGHTVSLVFADWAVDGAA
ncbi:alpha/beta fold hydrolase [Blastococcus sp. TML/M2B]|uniref:alpha/beta fold hydrolase n=1 Tax=unclassified Blastococcus TaxID=2619396 RepID=UPI00190BC232|nr:MULTISPECIES: alpha/beta fold hydrolase [unclassified Blastococcus]MBN1094387.1 alpha/beta fold hydrolase [Blastococcus sp. TML/M2B]MBN1095348.1 alpha/beta fold hydrolase [Blastococcus sp. TML/C7B]